MTRPIADLPTPSLVLDLPRFDANIAMMRAVAERAPGLTLRPHLKTIKSVDAAARAVPRDAPITVSTLAEAEAFFAAGWHDILYAVGIEPGKLSRAAALVDRGCRLGVILDSMAAAEAVIASGTRFAVSIEIDSDGHRAGLKPGDPAIAAIGLRLHAAGLTIGVMTHAGGGSYGARDAAELRHWAHVEQLAVRDAAAMLRAAGVPVASVSVGSTPTALAGESFEGITELRVGVYMTGDLVMAGLGVMAEEAIALSVLTSVIGHRSDRDWLIVDAGWMAMSRDRGTQAQRVDHGFGVVRGAGGEDVGDMVMIAANQEHGIVARRDGGAIDFARLPIGARLTVLPNHACATAAQHGGYHVIEDGEAIAWWPRFGGW